MKKSALVALASIIYAVIDIGWNVLVMPMYAAIYGAYGGDRSFVRESFAEAGIAGAIGILVFFVLLGAANVQFAVTPGVEARSVRKAIKNAFLLGCAAYATYIVPIYLMISGTPSILIPIDILIGGGLSVATSAIVTAIALRRA